MFEPNIKELAFLLDTFASDAVGYTATTVCRQKCHSMNVAAVQPTSRWCDYVTDKG